MEPNQNKIDEAVLALLHLTSFREGKGDLAIARAWKGHDFDALNRLCEKWFNFDPRNKNKSVVFTKAGEKKAEESFEKLFCD